MIPRSFFPVRAMKSLPFPTVRRLATAAAAVGMLVAGGAAAAEKARTTATKPDAILTPAQLRECLAQQGRKDKATEAALKTKGEIASEKAAIDRSGTALSDEATTLDRTSEEAVEAYNAKVDERNKRIEAYEAKVAAYNKDAEAVQAMSDAHAKSCGNRRYDDRDLADIQKKR